MGGLGGNRVLRAQSARKSVGKISAILQAALFSFLLAFIFLEFAGLVTVAIVVTPSMEPLLPKGSAGVFVKTGKYGVGDVILFRVHGCLVAHRVVAETEKGFRTKGDYNGVLDPWVVPENAILGKLALSIPMLGYAVYFLRSPLIFAAVSTAIFVIFTWDSFCSEA
ncbi:MAG: signal peptidase I [Candidatus Freyarchaeota archaeon]|nr:signal peptidase I [Candidatus Jordarchaeia archaeon]